MEKISEISFKEIQDIIDAFQIASAQGFAISKTKCLLSVLKAKNLLVVRHFKYLNEDKVISSVNELANMFKEIDRFVDLKSDKEFDEYFTFL